MMQPAAGNHLLGRVLAERYRIDALLGEGSTGAVFLGEHLLMRKKVAIKLLHPETGLKSEAVQRFEREALAAAHIDHPNVACATDFGRLPDGAFFLVLEYAESKSLHKVLAEEGPLAPVRAVHIAAQIVAALIKAHEMGIVHRDLKPENIMLVERDDDPDFVKILDFGIAKVPVAEFKGKQARAGEVLTRRGVVYGTPAYMSPEQAMGQEIDHRADLYSLGVMLYEMLCGRRPFHTDNTMALMMRLIAEQPPALSSWLPPGVRVLPELECLVMRLLCKERDQRVGSARELSTALRQLEALLGGAPRASFHSMVGWPAPHPSWPAPAVPHSSWPAPPVPHPSWPAPAAPHSSWPAPAAERSSWAAPPPLVPPPARVPSMAALAFDATLMGESAFVAPQDELSPKDAPGVALAGERPLLAAPLAKMPLLAFAAMVSVALLVAIGRMLSPGDAGSFSATDSTAPRVTHTR